MLSPNVEHTHFNSTNQYWKTTDMLILLLSHNDNKPMPCIVWKYTMFLLFVYPFSKCYCLCDMLVWILSLPPLGQLSPPVWFAMCRLEKYSLQCILCKLQCATCSCDHCDYPPSVKGYWHSLTLTCKSRPEVNLSLFRVVQGHFTRRLVVVNNGVKGSKLRFDLTWVLFHLIYINLLYTHCVITTLVWYHSVCANTAMHKFTAKR